VKSVPWQIQAAEFSAYHRQLRFRYQKWDSYVDGQLRLLPESLCLTRSEHEQIVATSERLAQILRRLERRVKQSPEMMDQLGIPKRVQELIQHEPESELQLARYDFSQTPDGQWQVCEFNEDVPGGFNEIISSVKLLSEYHSGYHFVDCFEQQLLAAIPAQGTVALMYATGYAEDLQHMLVIQQVLRDRGQESVLCSPRHLRKTWRGFTAGGQRVSFGLRFYPGEWFSLLENQRDWWQAVAKWRMLNPLTRLISQSKAIFAMWDRPEYLSPADVTFLKQVTPASFCWASVDLASHLEQVGQQQREWVLKQNFGRMGDNVVMGSLVTPLIWQATLAEVQKKPQDWIAQRRFSVAPLVLESGVVYPAVGAYLINGRFVGYYSRVAKAPFLTHQATYVPTVIDD